MKSTPTTATTSWPMRSSISVWLCSLLALLAVGQIEQAAGLECECNLNMVVMTPYGTNPVAFGRADALLERKHGVSDKEEWLSTVANISKARNLDMTNWTERVASIVELWPGCEDGTCRIEKGDATSVWSTMAKIQYSYWQKFLNVPVPPVNSNFEPKCVKAHMRLWRGRPGYIVETTTALYIGCAIRPPSPDVGWLGGDSYDLGRPCNETADGKYGHQAFCVLEDLTPTATNSPTTGSQSATTAAESTSAIATEPTTTPKPNGTTLQTSEATTSGTSKRAKDPIVAMVAAILLSLAATRLLPTTIKAG